MKTLKLAFNSHYYLLSTVFFLVASSVGFY